MSAQRFLITGLPESRTAWMSVLTTTGNSMCYHEPIAGMRDVSEIERVYQSDFYKYVGVSDSTLGFFLDFILKNIRPRTLIIERDPAEVMADLTGLGLPETNFVHLLLDRLKAVRNDPLVMWVPFDALSNKRVMQKAFWHLMPGAAFDEARYEMLNDMTIDLVPERVAANREKHQDDFNVLLRDIIPLIKHTGRQRARNLH